MNFMDLRQWINFLEKGGELRRIIAEVDWIGEIGAVARRVLERKGPALLFENIKAIRVVAAQSSSREASPLALVLPSPSVFPPISPIESWFCT